MGIIIEYMFESKQGIEGLNSHENAYWNFLEDLRELKSEGKDKILSNTLDSVIRTHIHERNRKNRIFKHFVKKAEKAGFLKFIKTGVWEITDNIILFGYGVN